MEGRRMEKRRYSATREPLDLDNFIANLLEDYEQGETMRIGQHRQSLSNGSLNFYPLGDLAIDTIALNAR